MSDAAAREQMNTEAGAVEPGLRVPFSADGERHAVRLRGRLTKLVAAKLALDLLFVCGLAIYTHAVTYRGGFDGELEHADRLGASGWVVDLEQTGAPVEVQLFLNGHFAAATLATEPRPDETQGVPHASGRRVFVFQFEQPRNGEYEARVYAVREGRGGARRTLQQLGDPRHFDWK
ncbi:MAG: hypothetical protein QOH49_3214 [Acidobacteriota bacterium]|jgi:hypothetical protein|nr:hypothetical protein [Acidobacteriota bacterium]